MRPVADKPRLVFCTQSPTGQARLLAIEKAFAECKNDRQRSQVQGTGREWFYEPFAKPLTTHAVGELALVVDERVLSLNERAIRSCSC